MIRIVGPFCIGLLAFTCIANYQVSEQTRVARQDLTRTEAAIAREEQSISVLEAEWQKVASPAEIQKMAEAQLGMQNAPSVQLASVRELPRRGDDSADVTTASAEAGPAEPQVFKAAMRRGM